MSSEPPGHVGDDPTPPAAWPSDVDPADPAEPVDSNAWTAPPPPQLPPHDWEHLDHGGDGAGAKRWRQLRWGPRSLTGRLVTGVVTLVVFLVLATGIGTYFALHSFLLNRLDQQLGPVADNNGHQVSTCLVRGLPTCGLFGPGGYRAPQTEWLAVLDGSGSSIIPVDATSLLRPMELAAAQRRAIISHPDLQRTIRTSDGAKLRVSAAVLSGPNGDLIVVSGLSTDEVDRTLHRLVTLEWIIGSVAIVVALVATTSGVQFSLRRLRRVTGTAHEVAAELSPDGKGLDRRVPVDESDTTEVGQLAASMNTLLAAVETQFAARLAREEQMRQFLADASHELRTPLTSIRGFAELAQMQGTEGEPEQTADNLARIESEGTRMSRLVDDLLTLARADREDVRRTEWVNVAEMLDEAISGVRASYASRQIDVSAPADLHIVGDPDQLVRVVRNLVNNAAVHTGPDGPIGVSAVRQGGWLVLRVTDAGPGLPPEAAAHVFERFWRADKSRTRARGGSGLGLAIVASIVETHGGTVRFDSAVATGSTVTVHLPLGTG